MEQIVGWFVFFPCAKVAGCTCSPYIEGFQQKPTPRAICPKKLGAESDNIHIVSQLNKSIAAHLLDWWHVHMSMTLNGLF